MYIFLITFLSLYGGMHFYVYLKLCSAIRPRPSLKFISIALLSVMTIAPLIVRTAEHFWREQTALILAWPSFIWMGFIFIFATTLLSSDLLLYTLHVIQKIFFRATQKSFSPLTVFIFSLLLALVASVYAFIEANRIRTEHIVITSSKLKHSDSRIRIVQISDVHIGLLMREKRLQKVIDKIIEARPDILVSTGDLVDGKLNRDDAISASNPLAALLAKVSAPMGKFAIVGNHEIHAGLPEALNFTSAAGFTILRNRSVTSGQNITITGIDDRSANRETPQITDEEKNILTTAPKSTFHLLLKHRPDIPIESDGHFDLQLSGHVHGGQIFPFNFLVKLKHHISCGTTVTKSGSTIYVSRGTGTWGPPLRLFAPPEITVIDLIRTP